MAWFKFSKPYDHRWPSRAMTHYRPDGGPHGDGVYNVKREVAETAKAKGYGTSTRSPAKAPDDGSERETSDGVAGGDTPAERDDTRSDELEPDDSDRDAAELPESPGT